MADITDALIQDDIASSLLSPSEQELEQAAPEREPSEYAVHGEDWLNEAIAEQQDNVFRDGDERAEAMRLERPEPTETQAHQVRQQPQEQRPEEQQQEREPSLEEIHAGISALDATVEEHGLNDPQSANEFAADFCSALGTDPYAAGVDVQTLGSTMAKVTLSAVNVYQQSGGDLSRLPEIPAASAQAFTHDILKSLGFDPRAVNVDERLLADTVMRGTLSFLDTYSQYGGKVSDMSKLNNPQSAEAFFGGWLRAFGIDRPVDRATALKFADAGGKYILSFLGKLGQVQERQAQSRQGQGSRSNSGRGRGQRVPQRFREAMKGTKAPRFRTNAGPNDPFSAAVMDGWSQETGKL